VTVSFFCSGLKNPPPCVFPLETLVGVGLSQKSDTPVNNDVKKHIGKAVTVCGRIITHGCEEADRSTTLDLDKPHWQNPVGIMISRDVRREFPPRPEAATCSATCASPGTIERRKNRYVGAVTDPGQITTTRNPPSVTYRRDAVRPCDGDVTLPTVVREVKPSYTMNAMRNKEQGNVFMEVVRPA